jgi:cell wall assembly regulator SMI1
MTAGTAAPGATAASSRLSGLLAAFDEAAEARMTAPASEEDLRRVEAALGARLPDALRAFLARLGGGLYEHGHEVFGPSRVMVHDIELVPDILSMRSRVLAEGGLGGDLVPFHRSGAVLHLMRTAGVGRGEIVSLPAGETFPDLAAFLEKVMLGALPSGT